MKRYIGKHEVLKKGPNREEIALIVLIFTIAFCLVCSAGMFFPTIEPVMEEAKIVELPPLPDDPLPMTISARKSTDTETVTEVVEEIDIPTTEKPVGFTNEHLEYYKGIVELSYATELDRVCKCTVGEYNDVSNYNQCAGVGWCICGRVDAGYGWFDKVITVGQFNGYSPYNTYPQELYDICLDVMARWLATHDGWTDEEVGRVLPPEYLWFTGNHPDRCNWFRNAYAGAYDILIP